MDPTQAEINAAFYDDSGDDNFAQDYAELQLDYAELRQYYANLQQENADLKQENADLKKQIADLQKQLSSRPSMNASAPEFKPTTTVKQPAEQATVNQAAEQSTVKQPVPRSARLPAGQATVAQPPPEEKKVQFVEEDAEKAKAIKAAKAKYNALSRLPQEGREVFDISYKKDEKSLSVLEFFCSIGLPQTSKQLLKYSNSFKKNKKERSEESCGVTMFMLYHFTTSQTRTSDQDFVDYLCEKKGCIQDEDFIRNVYSQKKND
jgi:regulator of replication initiation timing